MSVKGAQEKITQAVIAWAGMVTAPTSTAIGRLADMSAQLRKSAAGFRLPPQMPAPGKKAKPSPVPAGPGDAHSRRAAGATG